MARDVNINERKQFEMDLRAISVNLSGVFGVFLQFLSNKFSRHSLKYLKIRGPILNSEIWS